MATTINKQRTIALLTSEAGSANRDAIDSLPVLEQFIYALCRENASPEQADAAFARLRDQFFDWNEVRVSSTRELEEVMAGLSEAESRAQRLLSFLQEVFETTFSFDLEGLHKKGVKQATKALSRYGAASDFVGSWVVQRTLGGHAIPLDGATLRCVRRLGLVEAEQEDPEAIRTILEHVVAKAKGHAFTDAVSTLAEDFCWEENPKCQECPLRNHCPSAAEFSTAEMAATRASRAKPR